MPYLGAASPTDVVVRFIIAINDIIIASCYFIIPLFMFYIYNKSVVKLSFKNPTYEREKYILKTVIGAFCSFIITCGITHIGNFVRFFWLEQLSRLTLIFMCSLASVYTVIILAIYGNDILNILNKIEITDIGSTKELKDALNIAIGWSVDMVSIHDCKKLRFLNVNQSWSAFGYTEKSITTFTLFEIVHNEDMDVIQNMKNRTYLPKEEHIFTYRLKTVDNRYIYVEASCQKGKLNNTDVFFIITRNIQQRIEKIDHDLTTQNEQVRVETNCTQAMLLAHDIRTPLSVFELGLVNLQQQKDFAISHRNILQTLHNSAKYMTFIINRIVDTSRVLQGEKPIPYYKDIDIIALVNNCLAILEDYPKTVKITSSYHFDVSSIIFRCDYEWIWSILINLLTNACDNTIYGYIELRVYYEDHDETKKPLVIFEVRDTGIGIDSKDKDKLWYPFATLRNKINPKHGIGIGLYSCAWKTRFLSGTYKTESNVDGGSIFIIKLPINERITNERILKVPRTSISLSSASNITSEIKRISFLVTPEDCSSIRILIVDDTMSFRKLFRRNLEMHGITTIDEADNGEVALQLLKKNIYDIAFVDYYMPIKNGEECISEYRIFENEEGIYPRLTCVLVTADNMASTSSVIVKNIFDNIINKPLDMKSIMNIIQDFFVNNVLQV